jgi:hypothetical protein
MKRFVTIIVVLMFMSIAIGCASIMTEEQLQQRTELRQDLASSVGNTQFVGDSSMDARGLCRTNLHGY